MCVYVCMYVCAFSLRFQIAIHLRNHNSSCRSNLQCFIFIFSWDPRPRSWPTTSLPRSRAGLHARPGHPRCRPPRDYRITPHYPSRAEPVSSSSSISGGSYLHCRNINRLYDTLKPLPSAPLGNALLLQRQHETTKQVVKTTSKSDRFSSSIRIGHLGEIEKQRDEARLRVATHTPVMVGVILLTVQVVNHLYDYT